VRLPASQHNARNSAVLGVLLLMLRLDLHGDAVERYRDAQARAKLAADEWVKAGRPLILEHANHVVGIHPSLKVLTEAELHTDKMRSSLRAEERGTWRVPVPRPGKSGPMIELSPAAELRSIEGGKT
jgi:hypothetical protein